MFADEDNGATSYSNNQCLGEILSFYYLGILCDTGWFYIETVGGKFLKAIYLFLSGKRGGGGRGTTHVLLPCFDPNKLS